jgi:hypothetical protein
LPLGLRRVTLLPMRITLLATALLSASPAAAETPWLPPNPEIEQLLGGFDLRNSWYAQRSSVRNIPVLGSANVSARTMRKARSTLIQFLAKVSPSLVRDLRRTGFAVVVIARGETVSDVPAVGNRFGPDGNARYWGGFGATPELPIAVATEANLTGGTDGENLLTYALATSLAEMVLKRERPSFQRDLDDAYARALAAGRWRQTYARATPDTYWAEGVQSWFGANRTGPRGGDGVHGHINSPRALKAHDPALYRLIDRIFGGVT